MMIRFGRRTLPGFLVAALLSSGCATASKRTSSPAPASAQAPAPTATSAPSTPSAPTVATSTPARVNTALVPVPQRLEDGLPQSAVTNFVTRHERYVARAKQGDVDVLFVGDSITQGWEGSGRPVWEEYYGSMKAASFGVGWDRTQHVLWRLQNGEAQGLSPKVVVLLIGTNNLGPNTVDETAEGMRAVVAELRSRFKSSKILVLGVFPRGAPGSTPRQSVGAVNTIVSKLADGQRVFYLDIGHVFVDADGVIGRDVMADLLHPTEKGYRLWAGAMKDRLTTLLR
ncbi:MAG: platelet-activating factor acetylhydrolase IB subunit [Vicinamibacterales bacterium]